MVRDHLHDHLREGLAFAISSQKPAAETPVYGKNTEEYVNSDISVDLSPSTNALRCASTSSMAVYVIS